MMGAEVVLDVDDAGEKKAARLVIGLHGLGVGNENCLDDFELSIGVHPRLGLKKCDNIVEAFIKSILLFRDAKTLALEDQADLEHLEGRKSDGHCCNSDSPTLRHENFCRRFSK